MTLIKSISGIRGTIGGAIGDNLTPLDAVKFTASYAKWLVGSKLAEETWSNLSPTYRMVKEVQKTVPEFWSESLAIIGMPGQYL